MKTEEVLLEIKTVSDGENYMVSKNLNCTYELFIGTIADVIKTVAESGEDIVEILEDLKEDLKNVTSN